MKYLSLFSGIEAASVAWKPLDWKPVAFSEIDPYPSAVLAARWPGVTNLGDVEGYRDWNIERPDVLVGGSPCQSFSVAGLRGGMADSRGNLALTFCRVVARFRPRWVVWENVPGVLSSDSGRAFGSILRALDVIGYGLAWRVLDAQHVRVDGFCGAVPQRRRRVFLVGNLGASAGAAAVLFDSASCGRGSPPRRQERPSPSVVVACGAAGGGVANTLTARMHKGFNTTLDEGQTPVISFNARQDPIHDTNGVSGPLSASLPQAEAIAAGVQVRRLTPRECERLQGFPDDYTLVPGPNGRLMSDTRRYMMLGNSMAVNVMRWIGTRIEMTEREVPI